MQELMQICINRNQGFEYLFDTKTQELIIENRKIIKELYLFTPTTKEEQEAGYLKLDRYREIQAALKEELPREFIEKMKPETSPQLDVTIQSEVPIKKHAECIEFLKSFIPQTQAAKAKEKYALYLELHDGIKDAPVLEIDPRSGENENQRRLNRARILTLIECNSCHVCGFPFVQMLDVHHVRPLYLGGTNEISNFTGLCCNCHRIVHRAIARRKVSQSVKEYFSVDAEMLERLESVVSKGIGEQE